jgi:hypothetical protein
MAIRAKSHSLMAGYTLLECMVCIGITALITSTCVLSTHHAGRVLSAYTNSVEQRIAITKTALALTAALRASERARIPVLTQVTSGSSLATASGGAHPAGSLSATSRPRPDSDVLSTIEVDPLYRGRIIRSEFNLGGVTLEICGVAKTPAPQQFRSHLALGLGNDALCELSGEPAQTSANCFTLRGTPLRGLINATDSCAPSSLLEYLPIVREQSLFIDRSGELRIISHIGLLLLENQPITRGLREFKLTPLKPHPDLTLFNIAIRASGAKAHNFISPASLTRTPLWNETLL